MVSSRPGLAFNCQLFSIRILVATIGICNRYDHFPSEIGQGCSIAASRRNKNKKKKKESADAHTHTTYYVCSYGTNEFND